MEEWENRREEGRRRKIGVLNKRENKLVGKEDKMNRSKTNLESWLWRRRRRSTREIVKAQIWLFFLWLFKRYKLTYSVHCSVYGKTVRLCFRSATLKCGMSGRDWSWDRMDGRESVIPLTIPGLKRGRGKGTLKRLKNSVNNYMACSVRGKKANKVPRSMHSLITSKNVSSVNSSGTEKSTKIYSVLKHFWHVPRTHFLSGLKFNLFEKYENFLYNFSGIPAKVLHEKWYKDFVLLLLLLIL